MLLTLATEANAAVRTAPPVAVTGTAPFSHRTNKMSARPRSHDPFVLCEPLQLQIHRANPHFSPDTDALWPGVRPLGSAALKEPVNGKIRRVTSQKTVRHFEKAGAEKKRDASVMHK